MDVLKVKLAEKLEKKSSQRLDILATAFSCPTQVLKVICNFLTFMQPYRTLAFLAGSASLIPHNGLIRADSLAVAV